MCSYALELLKFREAGVEVIVKVRSCARFVHSEHLPMVQRLYVLGHHLQEGIMLT